MCTKKGIAYMLITVMLLSTILSETLPVKVSAAEAVDYLHDTIDLYSQYSYTDPNDITDDVFFGVWENDEWVKQPYLVYEDYPELLPVENAAKMGSYDLCKEELLKYYKSTLRTYPVSIRNIMNDTNRMTAELYAHNFFGVPSPKKRLDLTTEGKWYDVNVTSNVKGVISNSSFAVTFGMVALEKDGNTARFASKETTLTDNSGISAMPYIVANINGEERTFYAQEDTYISGDTNSTADFSSEEWIMAEEPTSSIDSNMKWNSDTKRGMIQFKFDGVKTTDTVNTAVLYLYGDYVTSDCSVEGEMLHDYKSVYLNTLPEPFWKEEEMNWERAGNKNGVSFDREKGPNLPGFEPGGPMGTNWKSSVTAGDWELALAQLYEYSGNEAYAYHAIRLLVNNCELIKGDYFIKSSGVFFVGNRLERVQQAMYCLIKSEYMTPDAFLTILKNIYGNFDWLAGYWAKGFESSNLGIIPMICGVTAGYNYRELRPMLDPTVYKKEPEESNGCQAYFYGGWLMTFYKRIEALLSIYIAEDGTFGDISMEYINYVFENMLDLFNDTQSYGADIETYFKDPWTQLNNAGEYMISKMSPLLSSWQNGDDHSFAGGSNKLPLKFLNLMENPHMRWVATERKEGKAPEYTMTQNDTKKFAIMRSSWDEDAVAMHINADGGDVHGHADDLHVSVFGFGDFLLVDPNNYNYNRTHPYTLWFEGTRGHNTIEINNTNQKGFTTYGQSEFTDVYGDKLYTAIGQPGVQGSIHPEKRESNNIYDYVLAESYNYKNHNSMNSDYDLFREVLFIKPGYFLVTDYIKPYNDDINIYKQNWHFRTNSNACLTENGNTVTNYESDNITANVGGNIIIAPVDRGDGMKATIENGMFSTACSSSIAYEALGSRYEKQKAGAVTFNTLLYPLAVGSSADIACEPIKLDVAEHEASAFSAVIAETNKEPRQISYYTLLDKTKKADRKFGAYETDAEQAFAEMTDAQPTTSLLKDGTYLKKSDGTYLIYSTQKLRDFGVSYNYDKENVELAGSLESSSEDFDIDNVTIYCDMKNISEVTINGNHVDYTRNGRYLYFGDDPILPEESKPEEIKDDNKTPGHSIGGGSGGGSVGGGGTKISGTSIVASNVEIPEHKAVVTPFDEELTGHWGEKEIKDMVVKNIVKGDGNSLKLKADITRGEFLAMLLRAANSEIKKYDNEFADVSADSWYADYIGTAYNLGWISGDGENAMPEKPITREEMAKILEGACPSSDGDENEVSINDFSEISQWAKPYVEKVVKQGLMNGYDDGNFYPKNKAKREEAIVVIYRMLEKKAK